MPTESITITKRWSWLSAITVEIECEPDTLPRIKLGLAVKAAFTSGADLTGAVLRGADLRDADLRGADLRDAVLRDADLRGADLTDAVLRGADLTDAVLRGADLTDAVLRDAVLRGEKISRIFAIANRLDGYTFYAAELQSGGYKIKAGCRWFNDVEYRNHVERDYPGTDKAAETLAILDFIAARAAQLKIGETAIAEAA
jgi:uncharacterized protein YjbI with pentapeptide repeats